MLASPPLRLSHQPTPMATSSRGIRYPQHLNIHRVPKQLAYQTTDYCSGPIASGQNQTRVSKTSPFGAVVFDQPASHESCNCASTPFLCYYATANGSRAFRPRHNVVLCGGPAIDVAPALRSQPVRSSYRLARNIDEPLHNPP